MCQVKYVICPDINEQVNPGSKIWRPPYVRSILKPYCEHCMGCWEDAKRRSYTVKFKLMAVEVAERKQFSCIDTASQFSCTDCMLLVPKLASKVDVEGRKKGRKAERD